VKKLGFGVGDIIRWWNEVLRNLVVREVRDLELKHGGEISNGLLKFKRSHYLHVLEWRQIITRTRRWGSVANDPDFVDLLGEARRLIVANDIAYIVPSQAAVPLFALDGRSNRSPGPEWKVEQDIRFFPCELNLCTDVFITCTEKSCDVVAKNVAVVHALKGSIPTVHGARDDGFSTAVLMLR
jgi:hypothetical protein